MESDGDTDKCIYTAEVKTSLYILDKKVKRLVHIDSVFFLLFLLDCFTYDENLQPRYIRL